MRSQSVIEKDSFTLHHRTKEALASPSFIRDGRKIIVYAGSAAHCLHVTGGTLGFYCRHAYAHANKDHSKRLPFALKGADAIFYSAFHHLGLRVKMQAVMEDLEDDYYADDDYADDSEKDAELVATGLHGLKLTEEGGDNNDERVVNVCHIVGDHSLQSKLILIYG